MEFLETCVLDRECPNGMECDLTHEYEMWKRLEKESDIMKDANLEQPKTIYDPSDYTKMAQDQIDKLSEINKGIQYIRNFDIDGVKALEECLNYLMESEQSHFEQWCEGHWRNPEDHIYHTAEIAKNWFEKRVK